MKLEIGLYYAQYMGMAFAAALAVIAAGGVALAAGRFIRPYGAAIMVIGIVLSIGVGTALSGRNLMFAVLNMEGGEGGGRVSVWLLRLCSLGLLATAMSMVIHRLADRGRSGLATGAGLFVAFVAYYFGTVIANGAFGTRPAFSHQSVYPLVLVCGVFAARESLDPRMLMRVLRNALVVFVVASCAFIAVNRNVVLQPGYRGILPGIDFRFWGLGSHANSFGPLTLLCLVVLYIEPIRSRWMQWFSLAVVCTAFILAQSKTAYIAGMAMALYLGTRRLVADLGQGFAGKAMSLSVATRLTGAFLGLCLLLLSPAVFDYGDLIDRVVATREGSEVASLTGRGIIWEAALREWRHNPLFGYGPAMWDPLHRMELGMRFAYSAHNQFVQAIGSGGLIGLGTLLYYLGWITVLSLRHGATTRGASTLLLIMLMVRMISETPLGLSNISNGDFLIHLTLLCVLFGAEAQRPKRAVAGMRAGHVPGTIVADRLGHA